jgi:hypothetical protein
MPYPGCIPRAPWPEQHKDPTVDDTAQKLADWAHQDAQLEVLKSIARSLDRVALALEALDPRVREALERLDRTDVGITLRRLRCERRDVGITLRRRERREDNGAA